MNNSQPVDSKFNHRAFRSQFAIFDSQPDDRPLHYLDSAATAQIPDQVISAMVNHDRTCRANVQRGGYRLAGQATDAYELAREVVGRYLNASSSREIVFTSGATAALNLLAWCLGSQLQPGDEILLSQLEHHSNILPWRAIAKQKNLHIRYLPVTESGRMDLSALSQLLTPRTRVVSLTHGSNATGAISDVAALVQAARSVGAKLVLDGSQSAPHGPLDVQAMGADFYVFSGHKCYGPTGIGVLWGREELLDELPEFMTGGGMVEQVAEDSEIFNRGVSRFEAGTPPITQAVGLAAALTWAMSFSWHELRAYCDELRDHLIEGLSAVPGIEFYSPLEGDDRLPLVSFLIEGIHPHDLVHILDEHGVAVRGGAHCAELLMRAQNCTATVRASIAPYNNLEDIEALVAAVHTARSVLT